MVPLVRVLPSGNLEIAGSQEIRVNNELRELQLRGLVRPEDIRPNNRIASEKIAEARVARDELAGVNRQIARKAEELAELLERRTELNNTSGFSSETHYHVCDVIEAASEHNYLFNSWVKDRLDALRGQFDLKYWPSLDQFVRVLAADAENAGMEATDPLTAAATMASRPSRADFFKALFAAIEENSARNYGLLPKGFKPTDGTLASLANCALDLGPDELADSTYVKRLRQRERNGGK